MPLPIGIRNPSVLFETGHANLNVHGGQPLNYRYRHDVLAALENHGIMPRPTTDPERVREFVNDLYRYEIRSLRDRLLRGEFPKDTYYDRVVTLRNKYSVLALKPFQFLE